MADGSIKPPLRRINLNEMDIGIGRSGNQHTSRLMVHYFGMNYYTWCVEFVEITQGTRSNRWNPNGLPDFMRLHGSAFLTIYIIILDKMILRNPVGQYFPSDSRWG